MSYKLTDVLGEENRPILDFFRYIVYAVFAYLNIKHDMIFILMILMISDMFFGVIKAMRLGMKIKMRTMLWGFCTKLSLLAIPMVVALMGKALDKDFIWTVDLAIKMLIVNEGFSVLANIISIKQNKDVENFDFVSLTINYMRDFMIDKFKKNLGK